MAAIAPPFRSAYKTWARPLIVPRFIADDLLCIPKRGLGLFVDLVLLSHDSKGVDASRYSIGTPVNKQVLSHSYTFTRGQAAKATRAT